MTPNQRTAIRLIEENEKLMKGYNVLSDRYQVVLQSNDDLTHRLVDAEDNIKELGQANELIMLDNNELGQRLVSCEELLKEVMERYMFDTDADGHPKCSIDELEEMWSKVNLILDK